MTGRKIISQTAIAGLGMWWVLQGSPADTPAFEDVTAASGIAFQHRTSRTAQKHLIESVTGGVAMFDYDGDGRLDLYFVNGAELKPGMKKGDVPIKTDERFWNRLYRNQGDGTFRDVTKAAGVAGRGYGMGAAAGDFDNDGRPDLYVTSYGGGKPSFHSGPRPDSDDTARAGGGSG